MMGFFIRRGNWRYTATSYLSDDGKQWGYWVGSEHYCHERWTSHEYTWVPTLAEAHYLTEQWIERNKVSR